MKKLTTSTLEDIGKYKDKAIRLASFYAKSDFECMTDNISRASYDDSGYDLLVAIEKDITKTAKEIEGVSKLLQTTDSNGVIVGATGEPNVNDIFKENINFDSDGNGILTLGSISINIHNPLGKDEIKDLLFKSIFNIGTAEFKSMKSGIRDAYTMNESEIDSEEDAIKYLAELPIRDRYKPILEKIKSIKGDYESTRAEYANVKDGERNKYDSLNIIDRQITGSRAMVDSIAKASTHVSSESIIQASSKHNKEDLDILRSMIVDNEYISDVEIDPDVDVNKMIDLVSQIEGLKLNIKKEFTLKARKLGNYKAKGLCVPQMSIVALNVDSPSSLIHELTHLADLSNEDLKNSSDREIMAQKYSNKIDTSKVDDSMTAYYTSTAEVMARLGEISYILNKYDYKGESFSVFAEMVRLEEGESKDMQVVKPIDQYIKNQNVYFGFGSDDLTPQEMMQIKNYYQKYWGVNSEIVESKNVISREDEEKFSTTHRKRNFKKKKIYEPTVFSNITRDTVVSSYERAGSTGLMEKMVFAEKILVNMRNLHRSKNRIRGDEVHRQFRTIEALFSHIEKSGSQEDREEAFKILTKNSGNYQIPNIAFLERLTESFPANMMKDLYEEATYEASDGRSGTMVVRQPEGAADYLNEYGKKVGRRMITGLQMDYLRNCTTDDIGRIIKDIKPNTKAFYEIIFLRLSLCKDSECQLELKELLSSEGLINIFKNDRVDVIRQLLSSRVGSYLSATTDTYSVGGNGDALAEEANSIRAEMESYRPDASWKDLYYLDNIDELIDDSIATTMEKYLDGSIYAGQEKNIKENYIFTEVLREVRNDIGDSNISNGPLFKKHSEKQVTKNKNKVI